MPATIAQEPFDAVDDSGSYSALLTALRGSQASGIYAIIDKSTEELLYIGESHSGRLFDTITRHFRQWRRDDAGNRRTGGIMYNRARVRIAFSVLDAGAAQAAQYAEIMARNPRDNDFDGTSARSPTTAAALEVSAREIEDNVIAPF